MLNALLMLIKACAELEDLSTHTNPWFVVGDLNCIGEDGERIGDNPRQRTDMEDFNKCINLSNLLELDSLGGLMSWTNGQAGRARKWAKLDRILINLPFMNNF